MKVRKMEIAVRDIPKFCAVFKVIKAPEWASWAVAKGDEVYCYGDPTTVTRQNGANIALGASYLKFVRYEQYGGSNHE